MKVLLVDDSRSMRLLVRRALRQSGLDGLDLREASDGREALGLIDASVPDLVLSDWNMPTMTGIELLRAVRAGGRAVPFGFITSESTAEMRDTALAAGAQFVVTKPFAGDDLRRAIEGAMRGDPPPPAPEPPPVADEPAAPPPPLSERVQRLLTDLLGRPVRVYATAAPAGPPALVAAYRRDDGEIGAIALANLDAAAHLGAALSAIPPAAAREQVRARRLEEALLSNVTEVMNVMAAAQNDAGCEHLALSGVFSGSTKPPLLVQSMLRKPGARCDLEVDVRDYGTGTLSFLSYPRVTGGP